MSEIQKYVILITTAFLIYVVFKTIYRALYINKQFPKFNLDDEEEVKQLAAQMGIQDKEEINVKQITKMLNDKKKSLIIEEVKLELIKVVLGISIIVITCLNIL